MNERLPLTVANLKANKTWPEMSRWISDFIANRPQFEGTIVVCPSFPFLAAASEEIRNLIDVYRAFDLNLKLGCQDISIFEQGAYTCEVAASQLFKVCQFAIIGHSERRQNFKEDDSMLARKVERARQSSLEPIFCVQGPETSIPPQVTIVAYEPVFAIGTGLPDTPENAFTVSREIKKRGDYKVIYGGSVTSDNVHSFLQEGTVDGVLVGGKSLDPFSFIGVVKNASY